MKNNDFVILNKWLQHFLNTIKYCYEIFCNDTIYSVLITDHNYRKALLRNTFNYMKYYGKVLFFFFSYK